MTVTLTQLAKQLGLSAATVSCIINGKTERFSEETISRVLRTADELGYRPNSSARAMRTGKFGCFALLHMSSSGRSHLPGRLLDGISEAIQTRGLQLAIGHVPDDRLNDVGYLPKVLRELSADGLLINYHQHFPTLLQQQVDLLRVPAIWINAEVDGQRICPDDFQASRLATELAIRRGHRHIAYIDFVNQLDQGHFSVRERLGGYQAAMQEAELTPRVIDNPRQLPPQQWPGLFKPLLDGPERPTALITYNVGIAVIARIAATEAGLRIPQDCSIIAIGEDDAAPLEMVDTVVLPWHAIGQRAVELLAAAVDGRDSAAPTDLTPRHIGFGTLAPPATT